MHLPDTCTNPSNLYLQQLDSHMSNECKLPLKKAGFKQFSRNGKMELSVSSLLQGRGTLWSDWEIDFLSITFHCSDFSSDFGYCISKAFIEGFSWYAFYAFLCQSVLSGSSAATGKK